MGRLATNIATTLMGKHKPIYDPAGKNKKIKQIHLEESITHMHKLYS
jgi:hypothetical protein